MFPFTRYILVSLLALFVAFSLAVSADTSVRAHYLADELTHPWSMDWLSDDELLITERDGNLIKLNQRTGERMTISGLPPIAVNGQGGLFDVRLLRDDQGHWVYLSLAGPHPAGGMGTELWRGRLVGDRIDAINNLFRMRHGGTSGRHFGGRLALDASYVYLTIGDRGEPERAQDLMDHAGSIIRLNHDGSVPTDNPFIERQALPELYSIGHRNPQGAAFHPETGELWTHEHGPQGGDEINRISAGLNYGWPTITYGRNYGLGTPIGEGTEKEGLEQPLLYWDPSIAPSGMAFYRGNALPQWRNHWFVGALKAQTLVKLSQTSNGIRQNERLFRGEFGRIRDVREGPDGALYLLTDSARGQLIRLSAD